MASATQARELSYATGSASGSMDAESAADLVEKTREFIEKDMKSIADAYAKKYNMPNTMQRISTFQPILEKWVGLVSDIDSVEALSDLYWQETYSKVDVNTYGMID